MEEFFQQGDQEKEMALPVSMLCDRGNVELPKSQCGFIQFVVRPIFQPLADFCNRPPISKSEDPSHVAEAATVASKWVASGSVWMEILSENTSKWKEMQAQSDAKEQDAPRMGRLTEGDESDLDSPDPGH